MQLDTDTARLQTTRLLGRGNFGVVYVAVVEEVFGENDFMCVGDKVVAKLQKTGGVETDREVAALQHLQTNPDETSLFTPLLLDLASNDDFTLVVTDYVPFSMDVFDVVVALGGLGRNDATRMIRIEIIWQMVAAVGGLHENGVYHRDVKPENFVTGELEHFTDDEMLEAWKDVSPLRQVPSLDGLTNLERYVALRTCSTDVDSNLEVAFVSHFVTAPLVVKIIDFGFSTMLDKSFPPDGSATFFGTPHYLDPWYTVCHAEMDVLYPAKDMHTAYRDMDAWSLGITAYVVFHGYLPFRDSSMSVVEHALSNFSDVESLALQLCYSSKVGDLVDVFHKLIGGYHALTQPVRGSVCVSDCRAVSAKMIDVVSARVEDGICHEEFEDMIVFAEDTAAITIIEDLLQIYPPDRSLDFANIVERLQAL